LSEQVFRAWSSVCVMAGSKRSLFHNTTDQFINYIIIVTQ